MPKGEAILSHVAECLRQVEGSGLEEGGWMGGDAWFGSINCAVELMKRKKVFSTFIIKQQQQYFPKEVLHAILRARFARRPAGHWVVMVAEIAKVKLFIMAYAWSNQGIRYLVSTCGKTVCHEKNYYSSFEDAYGNVQTKELARPAIAHMLYEFLPLIDEHNKARQSSLALEKVWPTKCGWVRLETSFAGISAVDMQRWDRHMSCRVDGRSLRLDGMDDFDIHLIVRPLQTGELAYRYGP